VSSNAIFCGLSTFKSRPSFQVEEFVVRIDSRKKYFPCISIKFELNLKWTFFITLYVIIETFKKCFVTVKEKF